MRSVGRGAQVLSWRNGMDPPELLGRKDNGMDK